MLGASSAKELAADLDLGENGSVRLAEWGWGPSWGHWRSSNEEMVEEPVTVVGFWRVTLLGVPLHRASIVGGRLQ